MEEDDAKKVIDIGFKEERKLRTFAEKFRTAVKVNHNWLKRMSVATDPKKATAFMSQIKTNWKKFQKTAKVFELAT